MNIRIISGKYGGRILDAPSGRRMHPMGERIRNAMFNSIGSEIKDAVVLDVFAGTGSVGLEALSRGAKHVTFVERDRLLQKILAGNIERLDAERQTELIRTSVFNWLSTSSPGTFDIIFADPPYTDPQLSTVSKLFGLLKPNALMVLSHPGKGEVPTKNGVVVVDNRSYGNADLTFYRREGA
jgi:16S rRNA (guanine966-N2)-methyltransferase